MVVTVVMISPSSNFFLWSELPESLMVMTSPSLIESSVFSSSSSLASSLMLSWSQLFVYYIGSSSGLKHMTSFWFNCLFMDGFPCLLVVRKKHADAYGKDSKHANAIHISIIGSCGGSVGSVLERIWEESVVLVVSLPALLVSCYHFLLHSKYFPDHLTSLICTQTFL